MTYYVAPVLPVVPVVSVVVEKVYFLFIALKRMETFVRRCCQDFGFGVKSLLL